MTAALPQYLMASALVHGGADGAGGRGTADPVCTVVRGQWPSALGLAGEVEGQ